MEIQLFGAARTVTGSCYSITVNDKKILIDCGMFQGNKKMNRKNYAPFGFKPTDYDAVLLTHAHLDHCGRIPKLVKEGFKGNIYTTKPTQELAEIVMLDSAHIQFFDTKHENKRRARVNLPPRSPLYTEDDAKGAVKLFKTVNYKEEVQITPNIKATFNDAGHILGAASILLAITEREKTTKILFSGDIGQYGTPIVDDPHPIKEADYVFIESTYGDREHPPLEERKQKLLNIIQDTHNRGGKLLIPSFALERTQELLYDLNELFEKNLIPKIQTFIDSPMAIKATEVFKKYPDFYDERVQDLLATGDNPFSFPGLEYSPTVKDSIAINSIKGPCIIIAGSGMCTAGRIKHHIRHHIDDSKSSILFVGYQAPGTLGYWIKSGSKEARLLGKHIPVKAKVASIDSFSGHADFHGLLNWLEIIRPNPKKVFVTHGDEDAALIMAQKIEKLGINTEVPHMEQKIHLK